MRRKRLRPLRARSFGPRSGLPAVKQNTAVLISSDEMTEAFDISDTTPSMCMQRHNFSRRDASTDNPNPFALQ